MRSFKSKVLSACAWAVPVLSSVFPGDPQAPHAQRVQRDGNVLKLDVHDNYAQATFSLPCAGCLGGHHTSRDDEALILSFKAHTHKEPCGASNVTLNGFYLPHEWQGDIATGSASYTGVTGVNADPQYLQHDLDLEWESICLHGEGNSDDTAQVLTVNIKAIDGRPIQTPSGFTISFKQQRSPPELLRLEPAPHRAASDKDQANSWLSPPPDLRLHLPSQATETDLPSQTPSTASLQDQLRGLKALRTEVQKLQDVIDQKEAYIRLQIEKESGSLQEQLRECDDLKCRVKTVANGAHGALRKFYYSFNSKHPHNEPLMGKPTDDEYHSVLKGNWAQLLDNDAHVDAIEDAAPPPSPSKDEHHPHPRMPSPTSPFVIAIEIVLGVLCCGCLVTVLRNTRCCGVQKRAERAAAAEERRNAREYRRAARRHAWRNWWRGNQRDQTRIEDYEEKRRLINDQEDVLESAMQEEIRQLRFAHSIVNELIGAEEGLSSPSVQSPRPQRPRHIHCPAPTHPDVPEAPYSPLSATSTYPPTSLPEMPSRPLSRSDSLPGYASSSPPAYEEDEDASRSVPNGFRNYSPSTTSSSSSSASSHWTPDSSVVDVSPRPSVDTCAETIYAESTETGVGEKN